RNQAELENDETEKQRLIKSAEVIDSKIAKNEVKIDSLNTLIKVKNYLISTSDQKMNSAISNLNEVEQREIVQLSNTIVAEPVSSGQIAINTETTNIESASEPVSEETSLETEPSESLPSESNLSDS